MRSGTLAIEFLPNPKQFAEVLANQLSGSSNFAFRHPKVVRSEVRVQYDLALSASLYDMDMRFMTPLAARITTMRNPSTSIPGTI